MNKFKSDGIIVVEEIWKFCDVLNLVVDYYENLKILSRMHKDFLNNAFI